MRPLETYSTVLTKLHRMQDLAVGDGPDQPTMHRKINAMVLDRRFFVVTFCLELARRLLAIQVQQSIFAPVHSRS